MIKHYVVFDPVTGAVLRVGFAPDDQIDIQAQEGETVVPAVQEALLILEQDPLPLVSQAVEMELADLDELPVDVLDNAEKAKKLKDWADIRKQYKNA